MRIILVLLFLTGVTCVAQSLAPAAVNVVLGVILPFSLGGELMAGFNASLDAVRFAITDAQTAGFLPSANITLKVIDSARGGDMSGSQSIFGALDLIQSGVAGIVGDGISDSSKLVASLTGVVMLPQCSPYSSTSDLSDKSRFPSFFRTVNTGSNLAFTLTQAMAAFSWSRVGVLAESGNNFIDTVTQEFVGLCANSNITTTTTGRFADDTSQTAINTITAALMATDTRIIAVFHVTSEAVGPMIVSLYKSGWLTSAPRVLLSLNDLAVAICDYTPTLCPEILASVPIAFLSELTEDAAVFDAFSAQYTLQTGLQYSAQGGVDFGRGYGCGFALVAGLHNLVQTVGNGDLSILSPINATYFKSMTLDMFNLTASVPGVRQPYMINANGDPIYSKYTITGARAIPSQNTSLPPLVKSTLNYILNAADGSVTAAMSSPTLWIGGKVPLDSPIRTSANVQWGGPGGIALICMAASTLLFVLVSAGVFWANRDHPEVRATSLLASMMVNLAALLGITSIGSYIGDPSTIVCHVRFWSSTLAYGTILAACLPKTYRVYKLLYSSVGGSAASQWEMARLAAFIIVCELGGAAVYSFVARPVATLEVLSLTSQQVECLSQSDGFKFGVTPLVTVNVAFILWGLYLTFFTRKVNSKYNEAKRIAACIYNTAIVMMVLAVLSTNTVASYDFFNAILIWYVVTSAVLILHVPSFLRIVRTSPTNVRTSHDFFSRASQGAFAETKVPRAGDPGHVPVSSRRQGPLSVQSSVLSANSTPLEANAGGGWRGSISSAPGAVDNFAAAVGEVGSRYAIFEVDILPSRFLWFLASWKRAEIWIIETKEHTLLQFFDVDQQKDQLCYGGALKSFELDLSQLIEGKRQGVTAILRGKTQDRQFQVKFSHVDQLDMFARHFGKERGT